MNKTMRNVLIAMVAMIAVAGAIVAMLVTGSCSKTASEPLSGVRADAVNYLIEQSGIKQRIHDTLQSQGYELAEQLGVPPEVIDFGISELDIQNWKAIPQPDNATPTAAYQVKAEGIDGQVITYQDPGYVTFETQGQSVTLQVPESAQKYLPLIGYADPLTDAVDEVPLNTQSR